MTGKEQLHAMISGLVRGMKTEDSSLRLSILDLDKPPQASDTNLFDVIEELEARPYRLFIGWAKGHIAIIWL